MRYAIVGLVTSMAVLLYLDRICISVAGKRLASEFHLNDDQLGLVFGAFFLAYGLGQVPAGWLGDRFGARVVLGGSVLAWSFLTGMTGVATGLLTLLAVRWVFGLCQAGAYPIAARVNSLWIPFRQRATTSSIIALGGRAGNVLAPGMTAFLIVYWDSWRAVFLVYALLGGVWFLLFWTIFRNTPGEHSLCNAGERALIEQSLPVNVTQPAGSARGLPWLAILSSRSLWLQCLLQLTGTCAWTFMITWLPTYFQRAYGVAEEEAGYLSSLPPLGGMVGCFLGGLATDRLTRAVGLRWGRGLVGLGSRFLAAGAMLAALAARDPYTAAAAFTCCYLVVDLGMGATWAFFQDAGGPYVGTFLGWANMFGNLGAFVSPIMVAKIVGAYDWPQAVATCGALYLVSGFCWLGIDSRVPIVAE
jgi:sugar phosphate permease